METDAVVRTKQHVGLRTLHATWLYISSWADCSPQTYRRLSTSRLWPDGCWQS
jgi:hypothetical protein